MSKTFTLFGRNFHVTLRKGYCKILTDNGGFGYYKGQGFWKNTFKK